MYCIVLYCIVLYCIVLYCIVMYCIVQIKLTEIWTLKKVCLNPLAPMLALTSCDEPWPFFHFWRHYFWPKLASSMLNFCGRKISFQWCPDQSGWSNGAWDMHKNAQKVEWKTQSKISCHYTWLLHGQFFPSCWGFLRSFLTASKPSRRPITAAKIVK